MKGFICPYCLKEHRRGECVCDEFDRLPGKRLVPSAFFDNAENMYIPVVGSTMSGKSAYVGSLVKILPWLNFKLTYESLEWYYRKYYAPMFELHCGIKADLRFLSDPIMLEAQSVLKNDGRYICDEKCGMALYDIMGAAFSKGYFADEAKLYDRLLEHATGIIYLIDPLQLDGIRRLLTGKAYLPNSIKDSVLELLRRIKSASKSKNGKFPPIAFTVTKTDMLKKYGIVADDGALARQSAFDDAGELIDSAEVQAEAEALLYKYADSELLKELDEINIKSFWGVSSFGILFGAADGTMPDGVYPLRAPDPLAWIFAVTKKYKIHWDESSLISKLTLR